jgi:hypothetical protein
MTFSLLQLLTTTSYSFSKLIQIYHNLKAH